MHEQPSETARSLQLFFAILLLPVTAITVSELCFCGKSVIPAVAIWSAGAASGAVCLSGALLCACIHLGAEKCLRPALILQIIASGLTAAQLILGIVAFCI